MWLVNLAPLSEAELVPQAVAQALGVREQPGRPLVQTLKDTLRSRKMLLVVDNCEHLRRLWSAWWTLSSIPARLAGPRHQPGDAQRRRRGELGGALAYSALLSPKRTHPRSWRLTSRCGCS